MRKELVRKVDYLEPQMPVNGVKIAIGCFDNRLRTPFNEFFQELLDTDSFIRMNFPGGAKLINDPWKGDLIIDEFFSKLLAERGSMEINILDHSECLAWKAFRTFESIREERDFHFKQLRKARRNLQRNFPGRNLNVRLYYSEHVAADGQLIYMPVDTAGKEIIKPFQMPKSHTSEKIVVGSFNWKTRMAFIDFLSTHLKTEKFFRLNFRGGSRIITDRYGSALMPDFFDTPIKKCETREIILLDQSGEQECIHMSRDEEFEYHARQLRAAKAHLCRGYKPFHMKVEMLYAEISPRFIEYYRVSEE